MNITIPNECNTWGEIKDSNNQEGEYIIIPYTGFTFGND